MMYLVFGEQELLINKMIDKLATVNANTVVITDLNSIENVNKVLIKNTNSDFTMPFIFAIAMQLMALKLVLLKGIDPDKSNVIAKITVTK